MPAGDWDLHVVLLRQYQLKPWEVDELDPDFLVELLANMAAEGKIASKQAKQQRGRTNG